MKPRSPLGIAQQAFTLLELMVVLVIIGLTLAMVQLNLSPSPTAKLVEESQRLATVMEHMSDDTATLGIPLQLVLSDGDYRVQRRDSIKQAWVDDNESPFDRHVLDDNVRWAAVSIDGTAQQLPVRMVWLPGSEPPDIDIQLHTGAEVRRLHVTPLGEVVVDNPADRPPTSP